MKREEVIDKIRKLLALQNSSNENEAQSAMLMAQKLMAQYAIEMSQVEDAPIDHNVFEEEGDKKAHKCRWKRALASLIASNFKCDVFHRGHNTYMTMFVGKRESIDICKEVYSSTIRFIDKEFALWWQSEGKWADEPYWQFLGLNSSRRERPLSESIRMKDSYARGFISRLSSRFAEQRREAEQEGWGLVLVKDQDVVAHMAAKKFSGHVSNNATGMDADAYGQGYNDCDTKFGDTGLKRVGGAV